MEAGAAGVGDACYDAGINWCWFTIQCGDDVAVFRLHMSEPPCWSLLERLDSPSLHPTPKSTLGFPYGAHDRRDPPAREGAAAREVPPAFAWLEEFLAGHCEGAARSSPSWCEYHGVEFFRAARGPHTAGDP